MEKINLLNLPTPLQKMNINLNNNIYIKRDDLTDFVLGGNKARKIEYFAKDILDKGCDCIVTYGSAQSNHCRIVASVARRLGLSCVLILEDSMYTEKIVGNRVFYKLTEAEIITTKYDKVPQTIEKTMNSLEAQGRKPYFITGGGHSYLGTRAYVRAYEELLEQGDEKGIDFDYIFVAAGTGTTHAGLVVGNKAANKKTKVIGISVARRQERGLQVLHECLKEYNEAYNYEFYYSMEDLIFVDDYIGEKYGDIYNGVVETIKQVIQTDSIILDPVYTGKAFCGMKEYIKKNGIEAKNILFIHTGGLPCLFENANQL
ncbi:pyridoxal-phosphate dependent enzyme [Turicibacter sanguinis]|uniref:1-aminocyclopropane-1-carboxylate deaminase/D-cysteine desulfhydrase n=1 Tax=Turicibacter sanguinis TaxID=154288 RepID=UPI001899BB2F|nr:pyridoxal-phosphate dependent enzyme [Turicibacter sanguinis]MDB8555539.1 pyridoxal-phosphate dependent enzyme [Turicibacter sanguinis]